MLKKLTIIFIFSFYICNNAFAKHDFIVLNKPGSITESLFQDSYGNPLTLHNFKGNVVILNFWATWCTPCLVEMPSLNQLQKLTKAYGVKIIPLLSNVTDVSKARTFYRRYKLRELSYFVDINQITAKSAKVTQIPTSYVINHNGQIVAYTKGSINWVKKDNIEFIKQIIKQGL